jgi:hypothetical protein
LEGGREEGGRREKEGDWLELVRMREEGFREEGKGGKKRRKEEEGRTRGHIFLHCSSITTCTKHVITESTWDALLGPLDHRPRALFQRRDEEE